MLRVFTLLAAFLAPAAGAAAQEGEWAAYRMLSHSWRKDASPVETVRVVLGPEEGGLRWWSVEIAPAGDLKPFKLFLLSGGVPVRSGSKLGRIARYRLSDLPGRTLDYVDAEAGGPLLPDFDFREHFVPRGISRGEFRDGFAQTALLLGHILALQETGKGGSFASSEGDLRTLRIDPGLIIGTSRNVKNAKPGRIHDPEKNYEYVKLTREDHEEMIAAGFNLFRGDPEQMAWVLDRPVYFLLRGEQIAYPLDLYRSNYFGSVQFFDEPATHLAGDKNALEAARRPVDLARLLESRVREQDRQKKTHLAAGLAKAGVALGEMELTQRHCPIWETRIQTAWYQLKGGGSGMVQESRYDLPKLRRVWKGLLEQDLEPTAEEMVLYDIAFLRGAARAFGRDWGIAIYGQADPGISPTAVTLAYDKGARYVWFWTTDHGHHLPYEEQLVLAKRVRDHAAANPRRPRAELVRAAKVAVAVPDGYEMGTLDFPWHWPKFKMDKPTPFGGRYGDVLRAGVLAAMQLAREGVEYDFAVDDEVLPRCGYDRVIRLREGE